MMTKKLQRGVERENCLNWFHQKRGKLQEMDCCRNTVKIVWFCLACCELREKTNTQRK